MTRDVTDIVKWHLVESRRDEIVKNVSAAQEEFRSGEVKKGIVDDLLCELRECINLEVFNRK